MASTPAVAAAERAGVAFSLHDYQHDPAAESYGLEAAEKLGVDPARVFKRARMADRTQAERTTGYVTGGISPIGQRRRLPTHLDASARNHEQIMVSAGRRGLQIELSPEDFVRLTGARVHPIAATI